MQTLREHGLSKFSHFVGKPSGVVRNRRRQGRIAGLARCQGCVQRAAGGLAPGVGRRELEDLPAARQPRLRRRRTRGRRRAHRSRPARAPLRSMPPTTWPRHTLNLAKPRWPSARAGCELAHRDGLRLHRGGLEASTHMTDCRPAASSSKTSRAWSPVVASAMATRWAQASAGRDSITFNPCWRRSSRASLAARTDVWPGRVWLPDVCRAGRHHPRRKTGRASPPTRASASRPACRWWKCWNPQPVPARHGGQPPPIAVAHGEGYANFKYRGNADKAIAAMRLRGQPRPRDRAVPVQAPTAAAGGLTAVTTADGRFTTMMPHPERVFRNVQMSWTKRRPVGSTAAGCASGAMRASGWGNRPIP